MDKNYKNYATVFPPNAQRHLNEDGFHIESGSPQGFPPNGVFYCNT